MTINGVKIGKHNPGKKRLSCFKKHIRLEKSLYKPYMNLPIFVPFEMLPLV